MKKLITAIVFLLISVNIYGQRKVIFSDVDNDYTNPYSHNQQVRREFRRGYEAGTGLIWDSTRIIPLLYSTPVALNRTVDSLSKLDTNIKIVMNFMNGYNAAYDKMNYNFYPVIMVSAPLHYFNGVNFNYVHSWDGDMLPSTILCGANFGEDTNTSAYDIEFHDYATEWGFNAPSGPIAVIAGKILAIADLRNCSIWEARYCARITGRSYTIQNGYGKINVDSAVAYTGVIPSDPYKSLGNIINDLHFSFVSDNSNYIIHDTILYSTGYRLFINDSLYQLQSSQSIFFTIPIDSFPPTSNGYKLTYQAYNKYDTTEISEPYYYRRCSDLLSIGRVSFSNKINNTYYFVFPQVIGADYYKIYLNDIYYESTEQTNFNIPNFNSELRNKLTYQAFTYLGCSTGISQSYYYPIRYYGKVLIKKSSKKQ